MKRKAEKSDVRQAWATAAIVVVVSILFGLVGLPWLGRKAASNAALTGKPAPDFILPLLSAHEKKVRRSDLEGRTLLLDFWASWCGPCREQIPIVDRVAKKHAGAKLSVYGINTSDTEAAAQEFLAAHPVSYPSLFDEDGAAVRLFGVEGLPTLVIIDREGNIRTVLTRVVRERELEELLESLL